MITLALDTSSTDSSLAIFSDDKILISKKHHSQKLQTGFFKVIEDTFRELSIEPANIGKLIVGIGPGSFTGVRIGVSLAKTFCQLTKASLIPIRSYFLALSDFERNAYYLPSIPSTRTECYAALFQINNDNEIISLHEIDDGGPMRVLHWFSRTDDLPIHIYGEASWMFPKLDFPEGKKIKIHDASETMPDAARACDLIKSFPMLNRTEDPLKLKPLYVRPSPAELQRIGGQKGKQ